MRISLVSPAIPMSFKSFPYHELVNVSNREMSGTFTHDFYIGEKVMSKTMLSKYRMLNDFINRAYLSGAQRAIEEHEGYTYLFQYEKSYDTALVGVYPEEPNEPTYKTIVKRQQLRLLVTKNCLNDCSYCANKQHDLSNIPKYKLSDITSDSIYCVNITGGEPSLVSDEVTKIIKQCNKEGILVFLYTSNPSYVANGFFGLNIEGITLTVHTITDLERFVLHNRRGKFSGYVNLRIRIMLPREVIPPKFMRYHVEPLKDCPLPEKEVLCSYQP